MGTHYPDTNKVSIAVALEKLNKVYESCKTVKQYLAANRFRSLFVKMYLHSAKVDTPLYMTIRFSIDQLEKKTLNSILIHSKSK